MASLAALATTPPLPSLTALAPLVGAAIAIYALVMIAVAWLARRRIDSVEDYVVAGRRLPWWLATPTLLATWFGAGTMLAVSDEVRATGLSATALDPIGAGLCLVIAGLVLAVPLWRMKLLTLPDFFARRFGRRAEVGAAVLMVPQYFGWIAAQYVALAGVIHLFFGTPMAIAMALVAAFGALYTLVGGMWAVTLTDAIQLVIVVVGLLVLLGVVLLEIGGPSGGGMLAGARQLYQELSPSHRTLIPTESAHALAGWLGLLCAGALGNLPGQDLAQRIFAARSAAVARVSCLLAGGAYLALGAVPVILALAASHLLPGTAGAGQATLPLLAGLFLSPGLAVLLVVTVISVVLSTIDSAILSPSTVIAQNLLRPALEGRSEAGPDLLALNRITVLAVAAVSLGVAYLGESAFSLLESSYELGLVSLLVPLLGGVYWPRSERTALAAMVLGTGTWLLHGLLGWETLLGLSLPIPVALGCAVLGALVYGLGPRPNETETETETEPEPDDAA